MKVVWFITLLAVCLMSCITIKPITINPIPVVVSFGGYTPDSNLVDADGGVSKAKHFFLVPAPDEK
jgi:hypothetical protein